MKNNWDSLKAELKKLGEYCENHKDCTECDFYNESNESEGCYFGNFSPYAWFDEWDNYLNEEAE